MCTSAHPFVDKYRDDIFSMKDYLQVCYDHKYFLDKQLKNECIISPTKTLNTV